MPLQTVLLRELAEKDPAAAKNLLKEVYSSLMKAQPAHRAYEDYDVWEERILKDGAKPLTKPFEGLLPHLEIAAVIGEGKKVVGMVYSELFPQSGHALSTYNHVAPGLSLDVRGKVTRDLITAERQMLQEAAKKHGVSLGDIYQYVRDGEKPLHPQHRIVNLSKDAHTIPPSWDYGKSLEELDDGEHASLAVVGNGRNVAKSIAPFLNGQAKYNTTVSSEELARLNEGWNHTHTQAADIASGTAAALRPRDIRAEMAAQYGGRG